MTARVPLRLLPDVSPQYEAMALERFCLSKRLNALVMHADFIEAHGEDATPFRADIARTLNAIGAIDQLLNVQEGVHHGKTE